MKIRPTAPAAVKPRATSSDNRQPSDVQAPRKRQRLIGDGSLASPPPRRGRHALAKPPADASQKDLARLRFQSVQIDLIKLPKRTLREHDESQITMLAASIGELGFNVPVILTRDYEVIAGAARIEAAKLNDMVEVPAVFADHLSGPAVEAFRIADNKLAQLGKWNEKALAAALKELLKFNFEPRVLGYQSLEIDILLQDDEAPEALDPPATERKTGYEIVLGDIFMLGAHRVMCGNTLDAAHCAALMGETKAAMAFLDAPYNVPIAGNVTRSRDCREFAYGSGEMTDVRFDVVRTPDTETHTSRSGPAIGFDRQTRTKRPRVGTWRVDRVSNVGARAP